MIIAKRPNMSPTSANPPSSAPPSAPPTTSGLRMTELLPLPDAKQLAAIARILHGEAGIVIAPGKENMVQSRLGRRLRELGLRGYDAYLGLVERDADERRRMVSALTTNVTHFFREPHHFEQLRKHVLPPLIARARRGGRVRLWSAGCSQGHEAWSMALTLLEMMPDAPRFDIRILASDIDPEALAVGIAAQYDQGVLSAVSAERRERYFERQGNMLTPVASMRALVSFRELNLHGSWPMRGKFDVIFCRNVVIYFDLNDQARLWARFAAALDPDGWLFVGHSERVPTEPATPFVSAGLTAYRLADRHAH